MPNKTLGVNSRERIHFDQDTRYARRAVREMDGVGLLLPKVALAPCASAALRRGARATLG